MELSVPAGWSTHRFCEVQLVSAAVGFVAHPPAAPQVLLSIEPPTNTHITLSTVLVSESPVNVVPAASATLEPFTSQGLPEETTPRNANILQALASVAGESNVGCDSVPLVRFHHTDNLPPVASPAWSPNSAQPVQLVKHACAVLVRECMGTMRMSLFWIPAVTGGRWQTFSARPDIGDSRMRRKAEH
jgi:hypothetical protein